MQRDRNYSLRVSPSEIGTQSNVISNGRVDASAGTDTDADAVARAAQRQGRAFKSRGSFHPPATRPSSPSALHAPFARCVRARVGKVAEAAHLKVYAERN